MDAWANLGGAPDFGRVIHRAAVASVADRGGRRPILIHGASGTGKSVAAALIVTGDDDARWLDCSGKSNLARWMCTRLRSAARGSEGTARDDAGGDGCWDLLDAVEDAISHGRTLGSALVLDDIAPSLDSSDIAEITEVSRVLWRRGVKVVVTTRDITTWSSRSLSSFILIGPETLAANHAEAAELLALAGATCESAEVASINAACCGHVGFLTLIGAQMQAFGSFGSGRRLPSFDACLDEIMNCRLTSSDAETLMLMGLHRNGDLSDLKFCGCRDPEAAAERIAAALPLVRVGRDGSGGFRFRTHDLVSGFCEDAAAEGSLRPTPEGIAACLRNLERRGDISRSIVVAGKCGSVEDVADWLERSGWELVAIGDGSAARRAIDSLPLALVLGRPRLLVLWAEVLSECGECDDALAKASAARGIAEHAGDGRTAMDAVVATMRALAFAGRLVEAAAIAQSIDSDDCAVRAEALICIGKGQLSQGDCLGAIRSLEMAISGLGFAGKESSLRARAECALSLTRMAMRGDFAGTAQTMHRLMAPGCGTALDRIKARGNLGVALTEIGRLERAEPLLKSTVTELERRGLGDWIGSYLPSLACVKVAAGGEEEACDLMRRGLHFSIEAGNETEAHQNRVYLAIGLRSMGRTEESLSQAERAFEGLAVQDLMMFRRLAALEVAASLVALGDPAAGRKWAETVVAESGFGENLYHAMRADMILAEIDRREGDLDAGVARLAASADHVLSENSNWQIAMYCRAFPELLGMFALAVGVDRLPVHMLRMILPEHAEASLIASKPFMDDQSWSALGLRLLGEEELSKLVARDGLPLCHVRLFGGLEVSVGGRTVRERDWRKRKARLLFAMLVTRGGRDVPRDEVFEYLWPELDEERAKNNLYVAWSTMKSALMGPGAKGPCPYIESVGGVCRTVRDTVRSDIDEFEDASAAAKAAASTGDIATAVVAYERLAAIYRGDLLPGDCYDDWFSPLREHFRTAFVDAMLRATQLLVDAGEPCNALAFVRRAIAMDPFREDLYQCALRCQIAAGQRSSAIDTYFQLRAKLSDELGLDPSAETRALYDQILAMEEGPGSSMWDEGTDY